MLVEQSAERPLDRSRRVFERFARRRFSRAESGQKGSHDLVPSSFPRAPSFIVAVDRQGAGARRAVRRRAARTARGKPRCRPVRDDAAAVRPVAAHPTRRQRRSPARRLPGKRRRAGQRPRRGSRRRMAARQLSPRRGADPRDPRRPAARLLSPAAEAGRPDLSPATRGYSASPGRSSPTPTATSIPTRCAASSRPISGSSRSRSASCGPSRSRCASSSSRTCAGSRTRSRPDELHATDADAAGRPASRIGRRPVGARNRHRRPLVRAAVGALRRPAREASPGPGPADDADARLARGAARATGRFDRRRGAGTPSSGRAPPTSRCATSSPACG